MFGDLGFEIIINNVDINIVENKHIPSFVPIFLLASNKLSNISDKHRIKYFSKKNKYFFRFFIKFNFDDDRSLNTCRSGPRSMRLYKVQVYGLGACHPVLGLELVH
jgi:hypothetical protein